MDNRTPNDVITIASPAPEAGQTSAVTFIDPVATALEDLKSLKEKRDTYLYNNNNKNTAELPEEIKERLKKEQTEQAMTSARWEAVTKSDNRPTSHTTIDAALKKLDKHTQEKPSEHPSIDDIKNKFDAINQLYKTTLTCLSDPQVTPEYRENLEQLLQHVGKMLYEYIQHNEMAKVHWENQTRMEAITKPFTIATDKESTEKDTNETIHSLGLLIALTVESIDHQNGREFGIAEATSRMKKYLDRNSDAFVYKIEMIPFNNDPIFRVIAYAKNDTELTSPLDSCVARITSAHNFENREAREILKSSDISKFILKSYHEIIPHYTQRNIDTRLGFCPRILEIMPDCRNGSISSRCNNANALAPKARVSESISLIKDMINFTILARKNNLYYPDQKPENGLEYYFGHVAFSDKKTAIMIDRKKHKTISIANGAVSLTPGYLPTEYRGKDGDISINMNRAEEFALGICLYELLTGDRISAKYDKAKPQALPLNVNHPIFQNSCGKELLKIIANLTEQKGLLSPSVSLKETLKQIDAILAKIPTDSWESVARSEPTPGHTQIPQTLQNPPAKPAPLPQAMLRRQAIEHVATFQNPSTSHTKANPDDVASAHSKTRKAPDIEPKGSRGLTK